MVADAFQRGAGVRLAAGVEFLPAVEAAGEARGDLRVLVVQVEHAVGDEGVAAAVGGVEARQVGAEGADQRIHLVRVADVEGRVGAQRLDRGQRVRPAAGRLRGQPFVDDQRLVLPAGVEIGERRLAFRAVGGIDVGQCGQRGELVGHVVGVPELLQRHLAGGRGVEFEQVGEADVAQGAAAGLFAGRCVGGVRRERGVEAGEFAFELLGEVAAQGVAGGVQGIRIHFVHALRPASFRRAGSGLRRRRRRHVRPGSAAGGGRRRQSRLARPAPGRRRWRPWRRESASRRGAGRLPRR